MVRTLDRRLAVQIGLGGCGAFVAGALSVLGVLAVVHLGPFSPAAEIRADQTGRRYYSKLSLWLDPAPPPPAR